MKDASTERGRFFKMRCAMTPMVPLCSDSPTLHTYIEFMMFKATYCVNTVTVEIFCDAAIYGSNLLRKCHGNGRYECC